MTSNCDWCGASLDDDCFSMNLLCVGEPTITNARKRVCDKCWDKIDAGELTVKIVLEKA